MEILQKLKLDLNTKDHYKTGDKISGLIMGNRFEGTVLVGPKDLAVYVETGKIQFQNYIHLMYMAPMSYIEINDDERVTNSYGKTRVEELFIELVDSILEFKFRINDIMQRKYDYLEKLRYRNEIVMDLRRDKSNARIRFKTGWLDEKSYVALCKDLKNQIREQDEWLRREFYRIFGDLLVHFKGIANIADVLRQVCETDGEELIIP